MNIAEKFGRWFVAGVWILAGIYCLLNVYYGAGFSRLWGFKAFNTQDAIYTFAGLAFLVAAFGIARHLRWARALSLALWALFGYWDLSALRAYSDVIWFPIIAFVLFVATLLWLLSSASREDSQQTILHT